MGGLRLDYYPERTENNYYEADSSIPITKEGQSSYLSYQVASTYLFSKAHLLRAVYARAHGSPFIVQMHQNDPTVPPLTRYGNRAFDLLTSDSVEVGWRSMLTDHLNLDFEVFYSYTRNFVNIYLGREDLANGLLIFQWDNIDTRASQLGATMSLEINVDRLRSILFATFQHTQIFDHAKDTFHFFDFGYNPRDPKNQSDFVHNGTPDVYGGAYFNYELSAKVNINLNIYYFSRHTVIRSDFIIGMMNQAEYKPAEFEIRQGFLANLCLTYRLLEFFTLKLNTRNVFNLRQQEFAWGDRNAAIYMLELHYAF